MAKPWRGQDLPLIDRHSEMIRKRLRNLASSPALAEVLTSFQNETGLSLAHEGPIVADRPSGLKRVGITIQWFCPTLGTRVGLGIETPLAHRVIDRSLGHQRSDAQNHLPTTPVEWGFWTVLAAKLTDLLNQSNTLPRLVLDRVGPDSFDTTGLGPCSTIAWELNHLDQPVGVIRAWVPATLTQDLETGSAQSNKLSPISLRIGKSSRSGPSSGRHDPPGRRRSAIASQTRFTLDRFTTCRLFIDPVRSGGLQNGFRPQPMVVCSQPGYRTSGPTIRSSTKA